MLDKHELEQIVRVWGTLGTVHYLWGWPGRVKSDRAIKKLWSWNGVLQFFFKQKTGFWKKKNLSFMKTVGHLKVWILINVPSCSSAGSNSRWSDIVPPNFEIFRPILSYGLTWYPNTKNVVAFSLEDLVQQFDLLRTIFKWQLIQLDMFCLAAIHSTYT